MQMWPRSAPRAPADSDGLAFSYIVAFFDEKTRQMQIERQQPLAMVDHHEIAFIEQRSRQNDASAIHGCDRGSAGHAEIEPLVRALYGTIEDTLDSKHVGDLG